MIFYDYWRSSSAWRVRIALHFKGIPFERRAVNLLAGEQNGAQLRALNPQAQVPVLALSPEGDGGRPRVLAQSMAILAYLEERFPTPSLFPGDAWRRARALQLAEAINAGIQPYQNLSLLNLLRERGVADPGAVARELNTRGLTALEEMARETAGEFLMGAAPTVADVYLVPQLYGARRFNVDLSPYPTLLRAEASAAALPVFESARPERQTDAPANP